MAAPLRRRASSLEMDNERLQKEQQMLQMQAGEVSEWIDKLMNLETPAAVKDPVEYLLSRLDSGVVLCELVQKINKDIKLSFKANAKPQSFFARENINKFVKTLPKFDLPAIALFEPSDLADRNNVKAVVNTLLLFAKASVKFGVAPPLLIQYELDLEEDANDAAGDDDDDDDDNDEKDDKDSNDEDNGDDDDNNEDDDDKDDDNKDDTEQATAATTGAPSTKGAKDDINSAGSVAATAKPLPESPSKAEIKRKKRAAAKARYKAGNMPQRRRGSVYAPGTKQPYEPDKSDAVDVRVAEIINKNNFLVPIRRVQVKSKKKRRNRGKKGGVGQFEYKIGKGMKVPVRIIRDMLVARVGQQWVDFETTVKEQS